MPSDDTKAQGGGADKDAANAGTGADGDAGNRAAKDVASITPVTFQNILDTALKKQASMYEGKISEVRGILSKQQEALDTLIASTDAARTRDDDKVKGKAPEKTGDAEILKLQKKVEEMTKLLDEERIAREKAVADSRSKQFERDVIDSLVRAGCNKPQAAFRVIRDDLKLDEEGHISIEYEDPALKQKLTLDLDGYVENVVREKQLPELFAARSKGGAQVSGSSDSRGKPKYEFTYEQWKDPKFQKEHDKEIQEAAKRGAVEPAPGWDSFHA